MAIMLIITINNQNINFMTIVRKSIIQDEIIDNSQFRKHLSFLISYFSQ